MLGSKLPRCPSSGPGASSPAGSSLTPCPATHCTPSSIVLDIQKNNLTLKHDRESKLEVKVSPASITVDSYRIEIKRVSGGVWCGISNSNIEDPWEAKIAGKYKIRGVATICGTEHFTSEKNMEVKFPTYAEIVSDAGVITETDREWQLTLNDATQVPNQRRERGFWIRLNTATNSYEFSNHVQGAFVGPGAFANIPLSSRPTDSPANPGPCDAGATYSVASFHTHPPNEFRAVAFPPSVTQPIGPSIADNNVDNGDDVPGVVYDHEESPAGSGAVPMGHPESSPAIRYHSRGKNNRSTPN